tara:strand:+ start:252 stop:479 length:228 start_codon:yes stop_codon:yes gene_type:complete
MIITEEVKRVFSKEVENHVIEHGGSYMDAVLKKCDDYIIEPQVAAKLLSRPIIEKLQIEGQSVNLIPKEKNQLPV